MVLHITVFFIKLNHFSWILHYPMQVIVEPLRIANIMNKENFLPRLDKQKFFIFIWKCIHVKIFYILLCKYKIRYIYLFIYKLYIFRFLVPAEISVAQFMWVLRKRISLPPERALFIYINRTIPQNRYVGTGTTVQWKWFCPEPIYVKYTPHLKYFSLDFVTTVCRRFNFIEII